MLSCEQIMSNDPLTVRPTLPVHELAELLLLKGTDGACVVDDGKLAGVVTSMDLVFQEKQVHLPTFIHFLNGLLPLEPFSARTKMELDKISGSIVADIMTQNPIVVGPETRLSKAATIMVEKHITILPVVSNKRLIGWITKRVLLRHLVEQATAGGETSQ